MSIELTKMAIQRVLDLQKEDAKLKKKYLRIQVIGGGCSGFSYHLDFDDKEISSEEKVFDFKEFRVVLDLKSLKLLKGSTLDYSGGLNGKGFVFSNPNAKRTCGCGTSFSV